MIKSLVSGWLHPSSDYKKPKDWAENLKPSAEETSARPGAVPAGLDETISAAQDALLRLQNREDGYWCPPLRGDTTTTSDTVMLLNFLGRGNSVKVRRYANFLLDSSRMWLIDWEDSIL